jgi:glycosyltransferase involved in cell wall biosynthesis
LGERVTLHKEKSELVSVIICNYNYEKFVGAAIASALAIDWPEVEVIVVDDGSTDGSRAVIEGFVTRGVTPLFYSNRGQTKATSEGYRHSRGEWIIFLNADDVIDACVVREAAAVMKLGWSMIQFQMRTIDESGAPLNSHFPKYRKDVSPALIRRWVAQTDNYPTPPSSGNLLSRSFLDKIFPLEEDMDRAPDSYFLSTAPFLGDVLTVRKPVVSYRIHGKNMGAQSLLSVERIETDLTRHFRRCSYSSRIASKYGIVVSPERWRYGFYNLSMRISSLRLAPARHPLKGDTVLKCMRDWAISVTKAQGLTLPRHIAASLWVFSVALAPEQLARLLVSWRFVPVSRPRLLQRLLQNA